MLNERTFVFCSMLPLLAALFISVPVGLALAAAVFAMRPRRIWMAE